MKLLQLLLLLSACFRITAQDIYKTPSGEKYHLATCRMVENVSEKISTAAAKDLGLQPCKICKPHNIYPLGVLPSNKQQGQAETVQCRGITKAGTRCKHKTRIGNGYCFQHNPDKQ